MSQDRSSMLPTIRYDPRIRLTGPECMTDAREVIRRAAKGHPIEVVRNMDYINLFHVLEKMPEAHKYILVRKELSPGIWTVFAVRKDNPALQN